MEAVSDEITKLDGKTVTEVIVRLNKNKEGKHTEYLYLTPDELRQWKQNPKLSKCFTRCCDAVLRINFPDYTVSVERSYDAVFVFISYDEPDVFTHEKERQQGRRWVIELEWNTAQIVQTVFKAILTSMEHRTREHFTYDNLAIFNPHHTIDQLCLLANDQARHEEDEE